MTVATVLGCATKKKRPPNPHQLFETEAAHTRALCRAIHLPHNIWEPCAGKGAISKVLRETHRRVHESDLVARRHTVTQANFFELKQPFDLAIVTNPPYRRAAKFIEHAYELEVRFLALLLKADFLNTLQRYKLTHDIGMPTHIFGLIKRPDFTGEGSPPMVCSWFVWDGWFAKESKYMLVDNRK